MTKVFKFDFEKFQKMDSKLCPCLLPTRENVNQDNMCPCKEFRSEGKCRCNLFIEICPECGSDTWKKTDTTEMNGGIIWDYYECEKCMHDENREPEGEKKNVETNMGK